MKQRILVGGLVTLGLLLAGVLFVFAFGTPQGAQEPVRSATTAQESASVPEMEDVATATTASADPADATDRAGGGSAEGTVVPEPDPASPLAVEIPGCVCHSDDPKLVEEHAGYRMNQCFGCHAGGMPEMGQ